MLLPVLSVTKMASVGVTVIGLAMVKVPPLAARAPVARVIVPAPVMLPPAARRRPAIDVAGVLLSAVDTLTTWVAEPAPTVVA